MSDNRDTIAAYLDLAAAKAKVLADQVRKGQTWEGDVSRGCGEIVTAANDAARLAGDRR